MRHLESKLLGGAHSWGQASVLSHVIQVAGWPPARLAWPGLCVPSMDKLIGPRELCGPVSLGKVASLSFSPFLDLTGAAGGLQPPLLPMPGFMGWRNAAAGAHNRGPSQDWESRPVRREFMKRQLTLCCCFLKNLLKITVSLSVVTSSLILIAPLFAVPGTFLHELLKSCEVYLSWGQGGTVRRLRECPALSPQNRYSQTWARIRIPGGHSDSAVLGGAGEFTFPVMLTAGLETVAESRTNKMALVQSREYKTNWSHSCQPRWLPVSHDTLVQEGNYLSPGWCGSVD